MTVRLTCNLAWQPTGMNFVCFTQHVTLAIDSSNPCALPDPYYFEQVSEHSRNWLRGRIAYVRRQFAASNSPFRESVERDLLELENEIPNMKYPWED